MGRISARVLGKEVVKSGGQSSLILDAEAALSQRLRDFLQEAELGLIGGGNDRFLRVLCSLNKAAGAILTSEMVNLHYSMDDTVDREALADPSEFQESPLKADEMIAQP